MMWVPAQQLSALRHSSVTLTCFVESHPDALTYWEHEGAMVQPSQRTAITNTPGAPAYKVNGATRQ